MVYGLNKGGRNHESESSFGYIFENELIHSLVESIIDK